MFDAHCGYKYRLYPTAEQKKMLDHHFFVSNQTYNICLDYQKETWEINKNLPKEKRVYPKSAEVDAVVKNALNSRNISYKTVIIQQARIHADGALRNAVTKPEFGFPNFKISSLDSQSFSWNNQGYSLIDDKNPKFKYLRLMKTNLKFRYHRDLPKDYKLNSITISRKAGRYFVSFGITYQTNVDLISKENLDIKRAVGIDTNVEAIAFSNGSLVSTNSKLLSKPKYSSRFKRLQCKQSRRIEIAKKTKKKTGKNFRKNQLQLNKISNKASNSKADLLHKLSKKTINEFDAIAVEDLKVKNMIKNEGNDKKARNRVIQDASFYRFLSFLEYKAVRNGKLFIKVNPAYTSKTCSNCGFINLKLKDERIFLCPNCKIKIHRDGNASKNILLLGLKSLGLGISLQTINDKPFELVCINGL